VKASKHARTTCSGLEWELISVVGALTLAGPASRLTKAKLLEFAPQVVRAARRLSYELSGGPAKPRMMVASKRGIA